VSDEDERTGSMGSPSGDAEAGMQYRGWGQERQGGQPSQGDPAAPADGQEPAQLPARWGARTEPEPEPEHEGQHRYYGDQVERGSPGGIQDALERDQTILAGGPTGVGPQPGEIMGSGGANLGSLTDERDDEGAPADEGGYAPGG
jgi:hypothetical protein